MKNKPARKRESSYVAQVKEAYRKGSKIQRQMIRAWMRRVLEGEDGNK